VGFENVSEGIPFGILASRSSHDVLGKFAFHLPFSVRQLTLLGQMKLISSVRMY
jgi:hypothetical protein